MAYESAESDNLLSAEKVECCFAAFSERDAHPKELSKRSPTCATRHSSAFDQSPVSPG
jgi:hypothetical protein